ncbi:hypothetical protein FOA52_011484 [Chlamydomonas sp. UWO 241]|nr:hypothetical protein FOA52_011484 [Chlamydomonas sp. UWO 241]
MLGRHSSIGHFVENAIHDPRLVDLATPQHLDAIKRGVPVDEQKPAAAATPTPAVKPPPASSVEDKGKEDANGLTALDRDYRPTKEMVSKIAQNGYLVVTWANWHYQDFVMTWVYHVKEAGITGYIVGAMDDQLLEALIAKDLNTFSMKSGLTTGDFGWGSKTFAKMGREKIRLIALFLRLGVHVVIADVDVLWLQNPLPYLDRYPEADVLTSSDHLSNTHDTDELELWPQAASSANIGIMLFRTNSAPTLAFVDEWVDIIEKDADVWDQNAFNDLFRRGTKILEGDPKHYFLGYDGKLKMGILPVALFASGHTFFTQRMWQRLGLKPYAVHATFQFAGTPGKKNRMRELMLFDDPPEYYDHQTGFVTWTMDGIEPLLATAGPRTNKMDLENVVGHFDLVNHQILRVRSAMAIATVLGRAVVIPELWCGLDRWWAPHRGTIPGSEFKLPFQCPLDHIYDLESWVRPFDFAGHGPPIEWRESSFYGNVRMSKAVNASRVVVEVCASASDAGCSDGSSPAPESAGRVRIAPGLASDKLKVALSGVAKYKTLDFTTMVSAFGNFSDPEQWGQFANRMRTYASIWCCIDDHPGHIHYDILFDVPHVDKFNRPFNGSGFGGWEDDESLQAAARRETVEEAGVRGCLVEPMLGAFPFTSCKPSAPTSRNQGKCIAHMFLMHVAEELEVWPEGHERQRHWVTLAGAHAHCRYDWMAEALCTFMADLEGWTARLREQAAAQAAQQQHACAGARATPPTAAGAGPGASAGAAAAEPAGAEATTGCDAEQQERVSM